MGVGGGSGYSPPPPQLKHGGNILLKFSKEGEGGAEHRGKISQNSLLETFAWNMILNAARNGG